MMRVLSVCRSYGTGGGMENVVHDRAVALRILGHQVEILHAEDGQYSDEFARRCVTRCDQWKPDLIHLDSYDSARPWWIDREERVALTLHSTPWSSFFSKWAMWMHAGAEEPSMSCLACRKQCEIIQRADAVLAISRYECGLLQDVCGIFRAKCVYNPIADYFFEMPRRDWPADGYLLSAGAPSGGFARGYKFAEQAALRCGIKWRCVSALSRRDMVAAYDGCRALVLPTFRLDGFDLTVAEALARNRPVIVTQCGPYRVDAAPGMTHVPFGDLDGLCEAIRSCAASPAKALLVVNLRHDPIRHAKAWLEAVS